MHDVKTAKEQAGILTAYLKTVGKNLKHTHALEAIARINGHETWNKFQAAAEAEPQVARTLADIFASGEVQKVCIDGLDHEILQYDGEALKVSFEDFKAGTSPYSHSHPCVELRFADDKRQTCWLTLGDLLESTRLDPRWSVKEGLWEVKLYGKDGPIAG